MKQLREKVDEAITGQMKGSWFSDIGFDGEADTDKMSQAAIQTVLSDPRIEGMVWALQNIRLATHNIAGDRAIHVLSTDALNAFNQMRSKS